MMNWSQLRKSRMRLRALDHPKIRALDEAAKDFQAAQSQYNKVKADAQAANSRLQVILSDDFYKVGEAAGMTSVSFQTVINQIQRGTFKGIGVLGHWYVLKEDVDEKVEEQRIMSGLA